MDAYRYPKPAVLAQLPVLGAAVIEASAGTGKTYTLEHLIVELLLRGDVDLSEILVVTFTEKATHELRGRVRAKLQSLLTPPVTPPAPGEPAWTIDARARERLRAALLAFDQATIATIHGFCHRVLSEQRFFAGRLLEESQVEHDKLAIEAFRSVLRRRLREPDLMPWLEAYLRRGSVQDLEDMVVEVSRNGAQLRSVHPEALQQALRALALCADGVGALADTLKASGAKKQFPSTAGRRLPELFALVTRAESDAALPDLIDEVNGLKAVGSQGYLHYFIDNLAALPTPDGYVQALLAGLRGVEAARLALDEALLAKLLPWLQQEVETQKLRRGLFDFDDMLTRVHSVLAGPDGAALCSRLRERYRYALIDEFQDTDDVQWDIFRRLFFGRRDGALFLVGDPKQAIYGFRGGDVHTYLRARHEVERAEGGMLHLRDCYRSTAALVEVTNLILGSPPEASLFTGEVRYDHPVRCARSNLRLTDATGKGVPPLHLLRIGRNKRLAEVMYDAVAEQVASLFQPEGRLYLSDSNEPVKPQDVFVLTRSRAEAQQVGAALEARHVPHVFFKQEGLFQSEEAEEFAALLAAIADPDDRAKRLRAWLSPFFGLSLAELDRCGELDDDHPLVERLRVWHALAAARAYERLFPMLLTESGLVRRLLFLTSDMRPLTNYRQLIEILQAEALRQRPSLDELLVDLRSYIQRSRLPEHPEGDMQRLASEGDAVQIMTIHHAKGLEAAVVFLCGGWSTSNRRRWSSSHDAEGRRRLHHATQAPREVLMAAEREAREEDERLLYVALTRAKARICLPLFVDDAGEACEPSGAYRYLNRRLVSLWQAWQRDPAGHALASVSTVPLEAGEAAELAGGAPGLPLALESTVDAAFVTRLSSWQPPSALLTAGRDSSREMAELRLRHMGFQVTSYSKLQRSQAAEASATEAASAAVSSGGTSLDAAEVEARAGRDRPGAQSVLPPGVRTGLLLHALLEEADLAALRAAASVTEWLADGPRRAWVEAVGSMHGMSPTQAHEAAAWAYRALREPWAGCERLLSRPVAELDGVYRELEFVFPLPSVATDAVTGAARAPLPEMTAHAGYVKGYIDLVVEDRGKVYWLDWKSDALDTYAPPQLTLHVSQHYGLQAQLYTLALLRMLHITDEQAYLERFGGYVYVFLRAAEQGAPAAVHVLPSWSQVGDWERELRQMSDAYALYSPIPGEHVE